MKTSRFECQCSAPQHTFRVWRIDDEPEAIIDIHLNQYYPWYKRIVLAIKYVLGYTIPDGHYDCVMLSVKEQEKLIEFLKDSK